ncbi:putative ankyrin repeat-containing protein [Acephala macrosclerotiorum]|nr:putative ankyrin repeat-containing protein [Acephala macrosclerotiorum]
MRLLELNNDGEVSLTKDFVGDNIPEYAILSHTWGADTEEVTFKDLMDGTGKGKSGYKKVCFCGEQARRDGLQYFWVDTCCIDKSSSAELSEAINSMYRWYQDAEVCYAYLADVPSESKFSDSRWFTRGWCLQELIAPSTVIFFDEKWKELGTKASLRQDVSECTGIPVDILSGDDLQTASIAQRMSWAAKRKTTKVEDLAYCLMGIFGINMPLLYGEGKRAFFRLQEEITKVSDDHSIFAWKSKEEKHGGLLATSPNAFKESANVVPSNPFVTYPTPLTVSNKGIHLAVRFVGTGHPGLGLAILHCTESGNDDRLIAIYVGDLFLTMEYFERVQCEKFELLDLRDFRSSQYSSRRICIQQRPLPSWKLSDATLTSLIGIREQAILLRPTQGRDNERANLLLSRSKTKPDLKDEDGRTPLSHAVRGECKTMVELFLARSDIEAYLTDGNGRTPLSHAAEIGNCNIVQLLLKNGVKVDSKDSGNWTPLWWAAGGGHEAVVQLLLKNGADIESKDKDYGRTPLSWAAWGGHEAIVQLLLKNGADIESKDKYSQMPLSCAAGGGHKAIVKLLESYSTYSL